MKIKFSYQTKYLEWWNTLSVKFCSSAIKIFNYSKSFSLLSYTHLEDEQSFKMLLFASGVLILRVESFQKCQPG